jgi:outer membrane protein OmpA-like peptidoglycan-associated protein
MKMKLSIQKRGMAIAMVILMLVFPFTSCKLNRTAKGGAIGAGIGGAVGGVIGHKAGNTVVGVLVGAAVGGAAGALIGRHMDKQAAELQNDLKGATVQRVGEGILITFNDGLQFDVNSSELRQNARTNLNELARVINKYDDTNVLIEGHTDITGSLSHNQTLSERRAESVRRFLIGQGVVATRLASVGYGPSQPLADNETVEGRQINRRVEVAIYANEKMKRAAERGQL